MKKNISSGWFNDAQSNGYTMHSVANSTHGAADTTHSEADLTHVNVHLMFVSLPLCIKSFYLSLCTSDGRESWHYI